MVSEMKRTQMIKTCAHQGYKMRCRRFDFVRTKSMSSLRSPTGLRSEEILRPERSRTLFVRRSRRTSASESSADYSSRFGRGFGCEHPSLHIPTHVFIHMPTPVGFAVVAGEDVKFMDNASLREQVFQQARRPQPRILVAYILSTVIKEHLQCSDL